MKQIDSKWKTIRAVDRLFGLGYCDIDNIEELMQNSKNLHYGVRFWLRNAKVTNKYECQYTKDTGIFFPSRTTIRQIDFVLADLSDPSKKIQAFMDDFYTAPDLINPDGYDGWCDAERTKIEDTVSLTGEYLPLQNRYTLIDHKPYFFDGYLEDIVRIRTFENLSLRQREHRPEGRLQVALRI